MDCEGCHPLWLKDGTRPTFADGHPKSPQLRVLSFQSARSEVPRRILPVCHIVKPLNRKTSRILTAREWLGRTNTAQGRRYTLRLSEKGKRRDGELPWRIHTNGSIRRWGVRQKSWASESLDSAMSYLYPQLVFYSNPTAYSKRTN